MICSQPSFGWVVVSAAYTKNRQPVVQPLPPDVAEHMKTYLAHLPSRKELWAGRWTQDAAEMIQRDLEAVGIAYVIPGSDGPLYCDFHALRHSYIALLDRSGATWKEAMQLARHSDPKLTMAVYGRASLQELAKTVAELPRFTTSSLPETEAGNSPIDPQTSTSACLLE